nr:hypothetical protein [Tanacetum cinerariifolium]
MELYDALVKSYETQKDLFDTYGEAFSLKRSRDEDKDQDPSARLDREMKRKYQVKTLNHLKNQSQRNISLQVSLKTPPALNISHLTSLPIQRSQVIQLMTRECDKIKIIKRVTMMNNPKKRLIPRMTATAERLDWHNPEGKQYPFNICKHLPLITKSSGYDPGYRQAAQRQEIPCQHFDEPLTEEEALSFIHDLGHTGEINLVGNMRFVSRHADTQVYGAILPQAMMNQAMLDSIAYKTCYAIALGAKPPKSRKVGFIIRDTPGVSVSKKKAPSKGDKGKCGFGTDEGTGTKPGVLDVPKYNSKSESESSYDEITKELYKDVDVNLEKDNADMTYTDQGGADDHNTKGPTQSSSTSSEFTSKLLNLENVDPAHIEIATLMDTVHVAAISETTSTFTTTITPIPPSLNPLPQKTTPTPTPTTSVVTTLILSLLVFASVFKFNKRVTNLEKDLLEIKQVDQYAKALFLISSIVDRFFGNKLRNVIKQVINAHTAESVLAKSSSQPQYSYAMAASLSEFKLTKILIKKIKENKSYLNAEYEKGIYDALVKSYEIDKDLFDTYGEAFSLKRSRNKDKDQDPSAIQTEGRKEEKQAKMLNQLKNQIQRSLSLQYETGHNDEQPKEEVTPKSDWFKKPERPPTPDPDWRPAFNLFKGTCKSRMELEYHFDECFKATTERLDWHNPEGKQYIFDVRKPLPLITNA